MDAWDTMDEHSALSTGDAWERLQALVTPDTNSLGIGTTLEVEPFETQLSVGCCEYELEVDRD